MGSEPWIPVVVYDACILYPFNLKNAVIQCAVDRLVHARWTDDIHEEWIGNLLEANPRLTRERLERTRDLMDAAVPGGRISGHHRWIPSVSLRDQNDRHIVAVAIEAKADAIVSADRHFRNRDLAPHALVVWRPDDFLMRLYRADPEATVASMANARRNLSRSEPTATEFVAGLRRTGNLAEFCRTLDRHLGDL
jgi:predicted nucleic acid-binding protein